MPGQSAVPDSESLFKIEVDCLAYISLFGCDFIFEKSLKEYQIELNALEKQAVPQD